MKAAGLELSKGPAVPADLKGIRREVAQTAKEEEKGGSEGGEKRRGRL